MPLIPSPPPGVYRDVPFSQYLSWDAVNASSLKAMGRSPAWCLEQRTNPKPPTPTLVLGTAIHCLLLEPRRFKTDYVEAPSGKGAKARRAALEDEGMICLPNTRATSHWDACKGIRKAARDSAEMRRIFKRIDHVEVSVVADLELPNGRRIRCKTRPDLGLKSAVLADLKSTLNASPGPFARDIVKFGYDLSAAFYIDVMAALGHRVDEYLFVCVEKQPPYQFAFYRLVDRAIERGRALYRHHLVRFAECQTAGHWPAYPDEFIDIDLPEWAFADQEEIDLLDGFDTGVVEDLYEPR
jgi:exodeoxyribonuclease VIII